MRYEHWWLKDEKLWIAIENLHSNTYIFIRTTLQVIMTKNGVQELMRHKDVSKNETKAFNSSET